MSRPTFTTVSELVLLSIRGIPREPPRDAEGKWILSELDKTLGGPLPRIPDDQGVVRALFRFEEENGIRYERLLTSGGGCHVALYHPEDAAKIVAWLKDRADEAAP